VWTGQVPSLLLSPPGDSPRPREDAHPVRRPPGRPAGTPQPRPVPVPPAVFRVGGHEVSIRIEQGRWLVSVDGAVLERWYPTQADAWVAGVGEADRVDRKAG
jgi:hypothetical protein